MAGIEAARDDRGSITDRIQAASDPNGHEHIPFNQSRAATPVILLTASIMAIGIYLPFSPLGAHVGMVPLPSTYFPWLVGILLSYCPAHGGR